MLETKITKSPKYLGLLTAVLVCCYVACLFLYNRLVELPFGVMTGGTFVFVFSVLTADIITEVYGYRETRKAIWCGIFTMLLTAFIAWVVIRLPSPGYWLPTNVAYSVAYSHIVRTAFFGSLAIMIGQYLNAYCISKWKIITKGRYFWLRSLGSVLVAQIVANSVAAVGIFITRIHNSHIWHIMLLDLVVMLVMESIGAIPAIFIVRYLKKREQLDVYDIHVNFNPFRLKG